MSIKIVCAQFKCKVGDKLANIKKMEALMKRIKKMEDHVDLIVFPECCVTGYECGYEFKHFAEPFPEGDAIKAIGTLAKNFNVHVIFGYPERGDDGVIYNSAAIMDNHGKALGNYRKVHLVEDVDTEYFQRGNKYEVFNTTIGKVGIMICWDSAFPETARILALKGAEIIAVPAAWEYPYDRDWDICIAARSFDNVCYVAGCNRVGTDRDTAYFGKSKIVGPLGGIIVEASNQEGYISAEVDLEELVHYRNGYYALLRDRCPETYDLIVKQV